MHNESMMVAGALAVIGVLLASRKNSGAKSAGLVFAALAALMVVAGLSG